MFFWLFFIITIILSISCTIYFILTGPKFWSYSAAAILIANIIIIALPIIRGYEIYARGGYDIFAHFAWSKTIVNTGYIDGADIYPGVHILSAIQDLFGIHDITILAAFISIFFYIFYLLSLFVLGTAIFKDKKAGVLISVFGTPLLFSYGHYAFYPFLFALMLVPIILLCLHKSNINGKREYYIIISLISLFIIFTHPLVTVIILIMLMALHGAMAASKKYNFGLDQEINVLSISVLIGAIFIFWYINFTRFQKMSESVYSAVIGVSSADTILTTNMEMVNRSGAPLITILESFIKIYGPMTIFFLVAFCLTIYLSKKFWIKKEHRKVMIYSVYFLLSIFLGIIFTIGNFIISELLRSTSFAIVMATIVCGIGFYILVTDARSRQKTQSIALIIIAILCSVSILTTFNVYYSPWIVSPGMYMTKMETSGDNWFLSNADPSIPTFSNSGTIYKYALYFQVTSELDILQSPDIFSEIPSRFGYDKNIYANQFLETLEIRSSYIITDELMRQRIFAYPEEMRTSRNQYSHEDLSRLNSDPTVMKLYTNREWDLFLLT